MWYKGHNYIYDQMVPAKQVIEQIFTVWEAHEWFAQREADTCDIQYTSSLSRTSQLIQQKGPQNMKRGMLIWA